MALNNDASLQQTGGRGQMNIPRTSMQAVDMERQAAMSTYPTPYSPYFEQPQTQQQQVIQRSMTTSPTQQFAGARRMSSPLQAGMMPNMQDGRNPSPTKRASFDPQLEEEASTQGRYPSPTKRKTIVVNPTSFDISSRPQMMPPQQEVASPRKSIMQQQGQPLSPRKSMMNIPPSQPVSPRKSMVQQQQVLHQSTMSPRKSMLQQPLSPRKSTFSQPGDGLQGNAARSVSMYRELAVPTSQQQEDFPASSSYVTDRSMSIAPAAQMQHDEEDDYDDDNTGIDDGGGGYDVQNVPVSRSTSMAPTVRFQDNQSVLMPTTSHNHIVNRSSTLARPSQVAAANTNPRMSVSPRLMQSQQQPQQSYPPVRSQSSIGRTKTISPSQMNLEQHRQSVISRSMSMSPTQMNMEQQQQPRLSSANLASAQGVRPGSPPQLNRYLSTAVPRVSVVTPSRASNVFQPPQLLPVPSSKRMQLPRASLEHGASSSSSRGPVNHEWHVSVTDVVLRSMSAIASAVAFCVMITNTVWINNQSISYSNFPAFRYVAGISATAFVMSILQLGIILSKKLRAQNLGIDVAITRPCLFSSMFVDQVLAYLLLSAGSVGVGALVYLPSICKSGTEISAEFCSRSTLSVVLTLVVSTMFVMSAILSTFRFYYCLCNL
ncbi:hypothetical protein GOP47_0009686 [Adiantum capillus-veneris]|uniref:Casparian strip membrane protein domain-containing protein n=1 Tax=Adiantum capillus-veneris TaxID=13818 RepID=A0A9D4ZJW7_ADICA|nr:hypothetical protein GOP47_0009686 [Adiantum capillus-veneris]